MAKPDDPMPDERLPLTDLDRLIHEPARLSIVVALVVGCSSAEDTTAGRSQTEPSTSTSAPQPSSPPATSPPTADGKAKISSTLTADADRGG